MRSPHIVRFVLVTALFLLAFAPFSARASAAGLNPPPEQALADFSPPLTSVNMTCRSTGGGTICQGTATFGFNAPGRIFCGSIPIVETATGTEQFTFKYDQDGNATALIMHQDIAQAPDNVLTNSLTGASVPVEEHLSVMVRFDTPGDYNTATFEFTGLLYYKVTEPGSGVILHDVGIVREAPPDFNFFVGGQHNLLDYFFYNQPSAIQPLCAALGA